MIIARSGVIDPTKCQVVDQNRLFFMVNSLTVERLDQSSITGWVFLNDLKGITMAHIASFSPAIGKKSMTVFQVSYTVVSEFNNTN